MYVFTMELIIGMRWMTFVESNDDSDNDDSIQHQETEIQQYDDRYGWL